MRTRADEFTNGGARRAKCAKRTQLPEAGHRGGVRRYRAGRTWAAVQTNPIERVPSLRCEVQNKANLGRRATGGRLSKQTQFGPAWAGPGSGRTKDATSPRCPASGNKANSRQSRRGLGMGGPLPPPYSPGPWRQTNPISIPMPIRRSAFPGDQLCETKPIPHWQDTPAFRGAIIPPCDPEAQWDEVSGAGMRGQNAQNEPNSLQDGAWGMRGVEQTRQTKPICPHGPGQVPGDGATARHIAPNEPNLPQMGREDRQPEPALSAANGPPNLDLPANEDRLQVVVLT
jgi:hypothetical protein